MSGTKWPFFEAVTQPPVKHRPTPPGIKAKPPAKGRKHFTLVYPASLAEAETVIKTALQDPDLIWLHYEAQDPCPKKQ